MLEISEPPRFRMVRCTLNESSLASLLEAMAKAGLNVAEFSATRDADGKFVVNLASKDEHSDQPHQLN